MGKDHLKFCLEKIITNTVSFVISNGAYLLFLTCFLLDVVEYLFISEKFS